MVDDYSPSVNSLGAVDWLSFTAALNGENVPETGDEILNHIRLSWASIRDLIALQWTQTGPFRVGYNASLTDEHNMITIYGRLDDTAVLVEISGRGCQHVRRFGMWELLTELYAEKATRIDLCVDLESVTRPIHFAETHTNEKIKTRTSIKSETGETEYIGSQKSDRFCRVYRYHEPHPRHKYLRVEMVFRRSACLPVAHALLSDGIIPATAAAGEIYGFTHPDWRHRASKPMPNHRPERGNAETVRWFYKQVVPAIKRLISEEILTQSEVTGALLGDKSRRVGENQ